MNHWEPDSPPKCGRGRRKPMWLTHPIPTAGPASPMGVAKMKFQTIYNAWIHNSDFNWDMSFISLDRRVGDHTGWPARE